MAVNLSAMRDIIMPGLEWEFTATPEQKAARDAEVATVMAKAGAEERARYDALSDEGKREYDALTIGMMPRLAR